MWQLKMPQVSSPLSQIVPLSQEKSGMNVPAPLAVGACLVSHIFRSVVAPDLASTFAVELQTFRAEISEAKLALSRSTLILEHCQTQTGILYFGIKFLALTEICLLVWLGWLFVGS